MKKLILALSITLLASQAFGADFRYSVPVPRPAPEKYADPSVPHIVPYQVAAVHLAQTNPDPFNTRGTAQVTQPPAQPGQPVVVQAAPAIDTQPGLLSWILTGVASLAGGAFGWNQLRQSTSRAKPEVNDLLLRVLESGKAGDLVQGLAGTVPFAGTAFSVLRPMIKDVLTEVLERKGAQAPIPSAPVRQTTPADLGLEQWKAELLGQIGNIVQQRIEAALAKRAST